MAKFKIGDKVRCIRNDEAHNTGRYGRSYGGSGWEEGFIFTIDDITNIGDIINTTISVYWHAKNNNGVYEPFLELVDMSYLYPKNAIIIDKNNGKGRIIEYKDRKIYILYDEDSIPLYIEEDFVKEIIKGEV